MHPDLCVYSEVEADVRLTIDEVRLIATATAGLAGVEAAEITLAFDKLLDRMEALATRSNGDR